MSGSFIRARLKWASLHISTAFIILSAQLHLAESLIAREASKSFAGSESGWCLLDVLSALSVAHFDLAGVIERVATSIPNKLLNLSAILADGEDKVVLGGANLEGGKALSEFGALLAELPGFLQRLEEVVSGDGGLALEVGKPENARMDGGKRVNNLTVDVVVDDVLEINLVEVVGPGVEHLEALVLDPLNAILLNVLLDELELGLIGGNRVLEVVLVDQLAGVAHERVDRFDTRARLQVLVLDLRVEGGDQKFELIAANLLQNADEHLLETLHVPVLVDGGVDDVGSEHLLSFVSEQEHEVVHLIHIIAGAHVLAEPEGQQLLEEVAQDAAKVLAKSFVLAGVGSGQLNFVCEWSADGERQSLSKFGHLCGNDS